jgi:hypothetical protein
MDKILLSSADVETLLKWRDQNIELVRRAPAPFKAILLEFPDTNISVKAINDAGRITFYISVNGARLGKITGLHLPGAFFKIYKDTTGLKRDDVQSVITVYISLMALIVFHGPVPAPAAGVINRPGKKNKAKQRKTTKGTTYILKRRGGDPIVTTPGTRAKPAGDFGVRGHYRRYKDGRTVWIKPYTKGSGKEKNKTYKL